MFHWIRGVAGRQNTDKRPTEQLDDQPHNPFSDVLLLSGHTSSVHQIEHIHDNKFITASDDGLAIIWDAETGDKLAVLRHRGDDSEEVALLCVLPLVSVSDMEQQCVIMTADSFGTLHVWNMNAYGDDPLRETSYRTSVKEHDGIIKCLVEFNKDLVCSGGTDLCLWDSRGKLMAKFSRSDLEEKSYIHSVLKLDSRHFGVVAASDYRSLAVYDINRSTMKETQNYDLKFIRYLLNTHQEKICAMESVSTNLFASGSVDGAVILWSTNSLNAMKMFTCADGMPREVSTAGQLTASLNTRSNTEIRQIIALGERHLFVAIGCGFRVYDVLTHEDSKGHPKPLVSMSAAHQRPISHMAFLEDRAILATASEDNTVRLWGRPNKLKRDSEGATVESPHNSQLEEFLGMELNPQRFRKRGTNPVHVTPVQLGELFLHSSRIMMVKYLGKYGLVSCSADNNVIVWKDTEKERDKLDFEINSCLYGDVNGDNYW